MAVDVLSLQIAVMIVEHCCTAMPRIQEERTLFIGAQQPINQIK